MVSAKVLTVAAALVLVAAALPDPTPDDGRNSPMGRVGGKYNEDSKKYFEYEKYDDRLARRGYGRDVESEHDSGGNGGRYGKDGVKGGEWGNIKDGGNGRGAADKKNSGSSDGRYGKGGYNGDEDGGQKPDIKEYKYQLRKPTYNLGKSGQTRPYEGVGGSVVIEHRAYPRPLKGKGSYLYKTGSSNQGYISRGASDNNNSFGADRKGTSHISSRPSNKNNRYGAPANNGEYGDYYNDSDPNDNFDSNGITNDETRDGNNGGANGANGGIQDTDNDAPLAQPFTDASVRGSGETQATTPSSNDRDDRGSPDEESDYSYDDRPSSSYPNSSPSQSGHDYKYEYGTYFSNSESNINEEYEQQYDRGNRSYSTESSRQKGDSGGNDVTVVE